MPNILSEYFPIFSLTKLVINYDCLILNDPSQYTTYSINQIKQSTIYICYIEKENIFNIQN